MSKITEQIPRQKFEIITDRICEIITDELANQYILNPEDILLAKVWKERFIQFDKTELPAINVFYESSDYDGNTPTTSKGNIKYNIEASVSAAHTDTERGDVLASLKCQRLLGIIRYILENPHYLRLGFDGLLEPFIFGTEIESVRMAEPTAKDGIQSIGGQIIFSVRAEENNGKIQPIIAEGYDTQVKLAQTDKGFYFIINN